MSDIDILQIHQSILNNFKKEESTMAWGVRCMRYNVSNEQCKFFLYGKPDSVQKERCYLYKDICTDSRVTETNKFVAYRMISDCKSKYLIYNYTDKSNSTTKT